VFKARGNSKKEWRVVNELLNRKSATNEIDKIKVNEEFICDKSKIENIFNDKFTDLNFITGSLNNDIHFNLVDDVY